MIKKLINCLFCLTLVLMHVEGQAKGVYLEPSEFLAQTFSEPVPKSKKIWIKKDLKEKIHSIMGHDLGVLRLRYWQKDLRSAWILEEIGKERPITAGIVINDNRIENIKVLEFRESRGWEVRYPFFTDQFTDVTLKADKKLDKHIDGISGATLSVKAMKKMARLALLLHREAQE